MNEVAARQAELYRRQAEENRATAEITKDAGCRDALWRLANGYDRLADNLERMASRAETGQPVEADHKSALH